MYLIKWGRGKSSGEETAMLIIERTGVAKSKGLIEKDVEALVII